ncbi:MAG: TonB-dependent siderophore receptor, partial [Acidovorax sp.]|nr:TonB-dependent siderophore receptor [Acidovorax sp.]
MHPMYWVDGPFRFPLSRLAGALAALGLGLGALQAHGQTTLPEMTVQGESPPTTAAPRSSVGTKSDTPLQEVPQSITVLTRESLEAQQAQSVPQALRYSAGVRAEQWGVDPRFDQFTIRGFDVGSSGIFRDGLSLPTQGFTGFNQEPYGLERLEILRGPSSVLYGQTEVGGLVNAQSKRPSTQPIREVGMTVGTKGRKQITADVGGAIDEQGDWSYRLTVVGREARGQVDYTKDNRLYVAPALTWKPDASMSLTLLAYLQNDSVPPNMYLPAVGTLQSGPYGRIPSNRYTGEPGVDHFDSEQRSVGYLLDKRFSDALRARQAVRYASSKVDYRSLYMTGLRDDLRTIDRADFAVQQKATVLTADQNLEWAARWGQAENTLLVGLDYTRVRLDGQKSYGTAPSLDVIAPVYGQSLSAAPVYEDARSTLTQTGLYVQDQIKWDSRYLLTLGARHDRGTNLVNDRLALTSTRQEDGATSGRVGLSWLGLQGWTPYASVATSFKPVVGQTALGQNFVPERGRQSEVGVKWAPAGQQTWVTAALFDLTKRNVLTADPDHLATGGQIQRGEVQVRGLELEADTVLARVWHVRGAYTHLNARITRNNDGNVGNRPALVARDTASAWLERTLGAGWRAGMGVRRVGSSFGDDANTVVTPGVTLLDALVGYRQGGWDVALNLNNL